MDDQQAYRAMVKFVRDYHSRGGSDDIFLMLDAMEPVGERATSDPALWHDWERCVAEVLAEDSTG